jgi:hypothetical protein
MKKQKVLKSEMGRDGTLPYLENSRSDNFRLTLYELPDLIGPLTETTDIGNWLTLSIILSKATVSTKSLFFLI